MTEKPKFIVLYTQKFKAHNIVMSSHQQFVLWEKDQLRMLALNAIEYA